MQTFGSRSLPPAELLPGPVAEALKVLAATRLRVQGASRDLGNHRRVGLAQAKAKDVEAHADALEKGQKAMAQGPKDSPTSEES